MAQILTFFAKQAVMAGAAEATLYSEIFQVEQGSQLAAQFRVLMSNDTLDSATGIVEQCMDQRLTPTGVWTQVGSNMVVGSPPNFGYQAVSNLQRFLRAKVKVPAGNSWVVSLDGVLRSKT